MDKQNELKLNLTEDEKRMFWGMSRYWNEVMRRNDRSPLIQEINHIHSILGIRLLNIIEYAVKKDRDENDNPRR